MRIKSSLCLGFGLVLCLCTVSRAVTLDALLDSAAAEPVLYGQPERCDSLVANISAYPTDSLLDRLDTPSATYYEILRRALVRQGYQARAALVRHLREAGAERRALPLLPVFEELGRAGDDKYLWPLFKSADPSLQIAALRCLARFGQPGKSWGRLTRLMTSRVAQVRLAAVWCAGEFLRRDPETRIPRKLVQALQRLLRDPLPQVRFSAWECLDAAGERPGGAPPLTVIRSTPGHAEPWRADEGSVGPGAAERGILSAARESAERAGPAQPGADQPLQFPLLVLSAVQSTPFGWPIR